MIDKGVYVKDFFGILVIGNENAYNVGEYLDNENCKSRKGLVHKFGKEWMYWKCEIG